MTSDGGKVTEEEINRYIETSRNIYNLPLFIDETPAITIATLSNRARRIKKIVWTKFNSSGLHSINALQFE